MHCAPFRVQHGGREALRRAGLSAAAKTCSYSCAAVDISSGIARRAVPLRQLSFLGHDRKLMQTRPGWPESTTVFLPLCLDLVDYTSGLAVTPDEQSSTTCSVIFIQTACVMDNADTQILIAL